MDHQTQSLETMPLEVTWHILSYLKFPRSTLAGLSEAQSHHTTPKAEQGLIRDAMDKTKPMEASPRAFDDMFSWSEVRHPFNVLAATSKTCRMLVESYCYHLVKTDNRFHLPFGRLETRGRARVYPDMSRIVYRRLWLQTAPRFCVFCGSSESSYPHRPQFRLLLLCANCFYAQALTLDEVRDYLHIPVEAALETNKVRGNGDSHFRWLLRVDVEALALKLYGTRAFHHTRRSVYDEEKPCGICRKAGAKQNGPSLRRSKRLLAAARLRKL